MLRQQSALAVAYYLSDALEDGPTVWLTKHLMEHETIIAKLESQRGILLLRSSVM